MNGNFIKATGAGNDFIVLNLLDVETREHWVKSGSRTFATLATQLCDRHFSIGADGFFALVPPVDPRHQFRWEFFNSDGSRAEMCGNAARCAALVYSISTGGVQKDIIFENENETVKCRWMESLVPQISAKIGVSLSHSPTLLQSGIFLGTQGQLVHAGVPHFCIPSKRKPELKEIKEISSALRQLKAFGPKGANVTYFWIEENSQSLGAVTYERGVEDFTLACGTGAMAAASAHAHALSLAVPWNLTVKMPGGALVVSKSQEGLELQGEAKMIAFFDACL